MLQDYDHRAQYFPETIATSKLLCLTGTDHFQSSMRLGRRQSPDPRQLEREGSSVFPDSAGLHHRRVPVFSGLSPGSRAISHPRIELSCMFNLKNLEVWFVTGSQHLYGVETLKLVAANSQEIAKAFDACFAIPVRVVFKPVAKTPQEITDLCQQANTAANCIGLITWCHTFSPSKMWINGLKLLRKPIAHLHTQHNREIPWNTIDMDFMNLNQAAHGDREHGFIMSRMRLSRKVVVGFWRDKSVQQQLGAWCRAAAAWHDWQGAIFCRFGDNMREVAVTEGDKVSAQMQFGYSVNGYGIGDLVQRVNAI